MKGHIMNAKTLHTLTAAGLFIFWIHAAVSGENPVKKNPLTPAEKRVILHKGTEAPFSGVYVNHHQPGIYLCKQCNAPLYRSDDKFESGCGWPAFDDAIGDAVQRIPDPDGRRTEIVCARCGGHLGHVFTGEGFTPKNTRHCVNAIALNFKSEKENIVKEKAYFAAGCFWGVEFLFQKLEGVLETRVGYMGGHKQNPTYKEVCQGNTGHFEAIEITYDSDQIDFDALTRYFFEIHDPSQTNGQGPDIGEQYKSVIFYNNEAQHEIAKSLIQALESKGVQVATDLRDQAVFWEAEGYHQDYYQKTGKFPYCHVHTKRF